MIFAKKPYAGVVRAWESGAVRPVCTELVAVRHPAYPDLWRVERYLLKPGSVIEWTLQDLGKRTPPAYARVLPDNSVALFASALDAFYFFSRRESK